MKFFYLVVIFLVINYCSAATNRSTAWLLADTQIFSTDKTWQPCKGQVAGGTILKTLSDYITITGTTTATVIKPPGGTTASSNAVATDTSSVFTAISIVFKITDAGATITKTFTLASFTAATGAAGMNFQMNSLTGGSATVAVDTMTIRTSSGAVWLLIERIGSYDEGAVVPGSSISWRAVQFTDFQSNSTVAVVAWQDGDDTTGPNAYYNHLYMVAIRSATANFDSGLIVDGCSSVRTSKRKRDVRTSSLTSCPLSSNTYSDTSIESNKASICSYASTTGTNFGNAVTVGGKVIDLVRATDNAYFSAAGSKFLIAVNFGVLIAMSSIIFSLLN